MADRPTIVVGTQLPLRITGVLERENGTWRFAQWHASIGVTNEESFGDGITTETGEAG